MKSYISVTEIAKVTSKERSTVIRWIKAGKFGNVRKVGNGYQVSLECFKEWWEKNIQNLGHQDKNS